MSLLCLLTGQKYIFFFNWNLGIWLRQYQTGKFVILKQCYHCPSMGTENKKKIENGAPHHNTTRVKVIIITFVRWLEINFGILLIRIHQILWIRIRIQSMRIHTVYNNEILIFRNYWLKKDVWFVSLIAFCNFLRSFFGSLNKAAIEIQSQIIIILWAIQSFFTYCVSKQSWFILSEYARQTGQAFLDMQH